MQIKGQLRSFIMENRCILVEVWHELQAGKKLISDLEQVGDLHDIND